MASKLNTQQVSDVLAPSKRYEAALYSAIVDNARKATTFALGNIDQDFPGVNPAHVAHMLKAARGDDKTLVVDMHSVHGVCLIKVQPASTNGKAAKPASTKKTSKPSASKTTPSK